MNRIEDPVWKQCLAETLGTAGLVFAGTGAIIIDELSGGRITHLGICITFGLIVSVMIYAIGHISGAHINPAVTLGFALARHLPWRRVPLFWGAQLSGAIGGSLVLRGLFGDVGNMGATVPSGTAWQSLGLEVVLASILMFVIMAVATDVRTVGQSAALAIGMTVGLEAIFAGPISGASMNPARSLGPALVSGQLQYVWVYLLAPVLGSGLAVIVCRYSQGE